MDSLRPLHDHVPARPTRQSRSVAIEIAGPPNKCPRSGASLGWGGNRTRPPCFRAQEGLYRRSVSCPRLRDGHNRRDARLVHRCGRPVRDPVRQPRHRQVDELPAGAAGVLAARHGGERYGAQVVEVACRSLSLAVALVAVLAVASSARADVAPLSVARTQRLEDEGVRDIIVKHRPDLSSSERADLRADAGRHAPAQPCRA